MSCALDGDCRRVNESVNISVFAQFQPTPWSNVSLANVTVGLLDSEDIHKPQPLALLGLMCNALMLFVAILGVPGNAITVWFFGRVSAKSSINTMLTAMAICDLLLLVTGAPLYFLIGVYSNTGQNDMLQVFNCCLMYFYTVSLMSQTGTAWMLVLITFERYIAVCRPFLALRLCTLSRARKAVVIVGVSAVLYNLVRFWEFQRDPQNGQIKELLSLHPDYRAVYMHWMYLSLVFLVPFSIIAFFNALIVRTVRSANLTRRRCAGSSRKFSRAQAEHKTAAMLLMVVMVFMLCNILAPALNAWKMIDNGHAETSSLFSFLSDLNNLLILLHSASNFIIYLGFCGEYRRHLKPCFELILCRYRRQPTDPDAPDLIRHCQLRNRRTIIGQSVQIDYPSARSNCRLCAEPVGGAGSVSVLAKDAESDKLSAVGVENLVTSSL